MGNPRQAERLRSLIVKQNRSGRFDLAIKEGSQQILDKVNAKQWMEAERAYERMIKDFEKTAGGELYYGLIRPYVERLVSMGRRTSNGRYRLFKEKRCAGLGSRKYHWFGNAKNY